MLVASSPCHAREFILTVGPALAPCLHAANAMTAKGTPQAAALHQAGAERRTSLASTLLHRKSGVSCGLSELTFVQPRKDHRSHDQNVNQRR